jgi:hypothetical protein
MTPRPLHELLQRGNEDFGLVVYTHSKAPLRHA